MTVYADVLTVLNLIVDYFLLSLTARILKRSITVIRLIAGAVVGALSSLYIFLPSVNAFSETVFRAVVCVIISLISFGYISLKQYLRTLAVFTAITFGYGGAMVALWYAFRPPGMIINNSVVYFNISPLFLVGFSVAAYFIILIVRCLTEKNGTYADKCSVSVFAEGNSAELTAIVDTGNSVEDIFSCSEIIVVDESTLYKLFDGYPTSENLKKRYRALPLETVSGTGMLNGYRCDRAVIEYDNRKIELNRPVLAVSRAELSDGYNAIINPKTLGE